MRFRRHRRRHRRRFRYNPYNRFRRNPARGPSLYNPLEDKDHPFKNDSAYKKIIKQFYSKRNYRKNPDPFYYGAGEDTQEGLYGSLFRRRRGRRSRKLSRRRRRNPQKAYYRSIYSTGSPRRRRNPHEDDPNTQIFSENIFARRRRRSRRRHNPFGYYELPTYDTGDAYWSRGRT